MTPKTERAVQALRDYLDQVGFVQLYKFIVTVNFYHANPNLLTWAHVQQVADFASYVSGDCSAFGLAACLMLKVPVDYDGLTPLERQVADLLLEEGLLRRAGGLIAMGPYQLISIGDMPLLVDARINYSGQGRHEVYVGVDSVLCSFYIDTANLGRGDRGLDLGTGTGLLGLFLGRFCDQVTVTDISPHALRLVELNRHLNRMTGTVTILQERYEETLARRGPYKVITFNPPFIPLPEGLEAPLFAKGVGHDGLDYCRMLVERLDDLLTPDGAAYMVADLLGTAEGPTFVAELDAYARRLGLRVDVFIDSRVDLTPGSVPFQTLGHLLHSDNPGRSPEECQRAVEELQHGALGATCAHLSVMVLRRARDLPPTLRVFNRRKGMPVGEAAVLRP